MRQHPDLVMKPLHWGGGRCMCISYADNSFRRIAQADPCVNGCHMSVQLLAASVGPWLPHGRPHDYGVARTAGGQSSAVSAADTSSGAAPGSLHTRRASGSDPDAGAGIACDASGCCVSGQWGDRFLYGRSAPGNGHFASDRRQPAGSSRVGERASDGRSPPYCCAGDA